MKMKPILIAFLIFFAFLMTQTATGQQQKGVVMAVKLTYKIPLPPFHTLDTIGKIWFKGDLIKVWFLHTTGIGTTRGDSTGVLEQTFVPDEANKDTVKFSIKRPHTENVVNLKTGDALEISYSKEEIVTCKTVRKPAPTVDSVAKIWLNEQKVISGHICRKLILINHVTKEQDTVFVAMDIKKVINPFYRFLDYFPMEFAANKVVTMHVVSISVEDIPDSVFAIPTGSVVFNNEKDYLNYIFRKKE